MSPTTACAWRRPCARSTRPSIRTTYRRRSPPRAPAWSSRSPRSSDVISLVWEAVEPPLRPVAVVARGQAAADLRRRTRELLDLGAELLVAHEASGWPSGWLMILGE